MRFECLVAQTEILTNDLCFKVTIGNFIPGFDSGVHKDSRAVTADPCLPGLGSGYFPSVSARLPADNQANCLLLGTPFTGLGQAQPGSAYFLEVVRLAIQMKSLLPATGSS